MFIRYLLTICSLALATLSCEAVIIYTNPEDIQVVGVITLPPLEPVGVDLNFDGVDDFEFTRMGGQFGVDLVPLNDNRTIVFPKLPPDIGSFLVPLDDSFLITSEISSPLAWINMSTSVSSCVNIGCIGLFLGQTAYIGTEFQIEGQTHYGWIQFEDRIGSSGGYLLDYAYESEPGVGILAGAIAIPEPSTYVSLILGLLALACYRQKYS